MVGNRFWTNDSVIQFAGGADPIAVIEEIAKSTLFRFLEAGGDGPPFNPIEIASTLGIEIIASTEVRDARTVYRGGKLAIEFNPNRPKSRINYSIAHEIAHTFFPDCKEEVRHRVMHKDMRGDDWQLEMLCNIGAAELLIPLSDIPELTERSLNIEKLVDLRSKFGVSTEALLLRLVRTTKRPTWVFAASRHDLHGSSYKIDYSISSVSSLPRLQSGSLIPRTSVVAECTAIGFTARGKETWDAALGTTRVECVGIPAFPGHPFPRVVGFLAPVAQASSDVRMPKIVRGDATKPRGEGKKLIAFIVNDTASRWGAGFALAVRRKWPNVQEDFNKWVDRKPDQFLLGNIHIYEADDSLIFAKMICQHGYGPSKRPRLRYAALENCLKQIAIEASERGASIHMPMIGSGEAGGNWSIILEMIERLVCREGPEVTVYQLPNSKQTKDVQQSLLFSTSA